MLFQTFCESMNTGFYKSGSIRLLLNQTALSDNMIIFSEELHFFLLYYLNSSENKSWYYEYKCNLKSSVSIRP